MDSNARQWQRYRAFECGASETFNQPDARLQCRVMANHDRLRALVMLNPDSNFNPASARVSMCQQAETTTAIRQCVDSALVRSRKQLDRAINEAERALSSSMRASLDSAGQVWRDYARQFCALIEDSMEGATMGPFVNQTCLLNLQDERTALLHAYTKSRRSG